MILGWTLEAAEGLRLPHTHLEMVGVRIKQRPLLSWREVDARDHAAHGASGHLDSGDIKRYKPGRALNALPLFGSQAVVSPSRKSQEPLQDVLATTTGNS